MYIYKAFGLIISSEIMLSELLEENSKEADVLIKIGKVPDTFENIVIEKGNKKIGKDQFILDNKGIAKYYVEKGSLIILEPYEDCLFEEVKLYLLGSCMGAILHQRRILPLHGSCLHVERQGILLTGDSGAGKSTIAAALMKKGHKMITDDVAAILLNDKDTPVVYPSYPSQKLWEDAIDRLGRKEDKNSLNRISNELEKYSVKSNEYFCREIIPLKALFEIVPAAVNDIIVDEIQGVDKLNVVIKNTYRRFMLRSMDNREWHFRQCIRIANHIQVYRITRPQNAHVENDIASVILGYDLQA